MTKFKLNQPVVIEMAGDLSGEFDELAEVIATDNEFVTVSFWDEDEQDYVQKDFDLFGNGNECVIVPMSEASEFMQSLHVVSK